MKNFLKSIFAMVAATQLALGAVVSPPLQSGFTAAGHSFNPIFSADGNHLLFVSHANNLVTNDNLGTSLDVFVRNLVTSNTVLASINISGTGGANADAAYPTISSNGQFVAFASYATDLVPGVTNITKQIFLRDLIAQTTILVSTAGMFWTGAADSGADFPQISGNGNWVVFESRSQNLTVGVTTYGGLDVYVRDLQNRSNLMVSINTGGSGANGSQGEKSYSPVITQSGRHVAFLSTSLFLTTDPPPWPSSSLGDVYVRDLVSKTTSWVSRNVPALFGGSGNPYRCSLPVISDDGRYVAFFAKQDFGDSLLLRHDLQTATTITISSAPTNTQHGVQISADGRFVLFEEMDGNFSQVRLWDAQLGSSVLISCNGEGVRGNAVMNPTATDVTFMGCGTNVHVVGTNTLGVQVRASVSTNGGASVGEYQFVTPVISPNGSRVAFAATANDLVTGDLNAASDVFLRDVNAGVTELITKALPSKPATTAFAHSFLNLNSISADGRFIVSTRYDDPSAYRDTNGLVDVYLTDTVNGTSVAVSINSNTFETNIPDGGVGPGTFVENTNAFESPIISVDGSTIYAVQRSLVNRTRIYRVRTVDAASGAGMFLASRGVNVSENGNSYLPSTSSNGLLLVFPSTSSDLVADVPDNNSLPDVYLRRMTVLTNGLLTGTNELVSISLSGTAGNNWSSNGIISPDGRWVIFESLANNLVPENTGGVPSLFARDLWSNVTHLVSVPVSNYFPVPRIAGSARISGNSRYVAFAATTTDSYSGLIFVHDLLTRSSTVKPYGSAPYSFVQAPAINHDGDLVAYKELEVSSGLVGQIVVWNRPAKQLEILDSRSFSSFHKAHVISGNGRYVIFVVKSTAYPHDGIQILVRDRLLGVTTLVSANAQGAAGNWSSTQPVMAADGRTVVFQSFASDLVTGDYNDKRDLFVLKLGSPDSEPDGMDDDWEVVYFDDLSRDGTDDFDGDGVSDLQEFLAGTDPTNSGSFFRVLTVTPAGGGSKLLIWFGNPSRSYRAEFKDNLNTATWTALTGTISWTGSTASINDPSAGSATNRFYRVVRLP